MTDIKYRRFNIKCVKIAVLCIPFSVFSILTFPFVFCENGDGFYGMAIVIMLFICGLIYAIKRRGTKWE